MKHIIEYDEYAICHAVRFSVIQCPRVSAYVRVQQREYALKTVSILTRHSTSSAATVCATSLTRCVLRSSCPRQLLVSFVES